MSKIIVNFDVNLDTKQLQILTQNKMQNNTQKYKKLGAKIQKVRRKPKINLQKNHAKLCSQIRKTLSGNVQNFARKHANAHLATKFCII